MAGGGDEPDYRLYAPDNPEKPVAVCLAYSWNRYLDGRDETRDVQTPDENPGARVVTVLESGEAPWAIVTNGKLWRLYSATLTLGLPTTTRLTWKRPWPWPTPTRRSGTSGSSSAESAFVTSEVQRDGQTRESSFLDRLLEESESYAKALGERLKDRVFEQVFPHFARAGFIAHLKGQVGLAGPRQASLLPVSEQLALKREPDEEFRRQVFNGTLTLLYRLLFLLYAESRDLLPVKEVRGYWERSLTKLKEDIAERGGAYRRCCSRPIEQGIPRFGGRHRSVRPPSGPFLRHRLGQPRPERAPLQRRTVHHEARLSRPHTGGRDRQVPGIPQDTRPLSWRLGLDLLARDLDDKRQDLVFIDYKSLGRPAARLHLRGAAGVQGANRPGEDGRGQGQEDRGGHPLSGSWSSPRRRC